MPFDFSEFNDVSLEKIKEWQKMQFSDEDILRWKKSGILVDKIYELKMKKLYLEYLRVKMQNENSLVNPFLDYDPIKEAENILNDLSND